MTDEYYEDYVAGLTSLKEKYPLDPENRASLPDFYPHDRHPIDGFHVVITLVDEEIHPLLIDLAGPEAPAYADDLTTLIQQFIRARKETELFGSRAPGSAQFLPATFGSYDSAPQPPMPQFYRQP
ncbi:hypothetical protein [Rhodococcus sp. OK302]|uniref:hypothetical protein n=1 Tax=Rhodococcus sp. OK302 TaxID=1882769 RepID=UPI000B943A20|nr:hypothetical protein [Rhodococcus sp. OK302]